MSETQESNKRPVSKKAALGRGLGSLLGEHTLEPSALPSFQADQEPSLKEGILEKKEPSKPSAAAAASSPLAAQAVPSAEPKVPETSRIWNIDIAKIRPNARQPRRIFAPEALLELASSVKEKGILQPIVCRKITDGNYEIIAGERRWRAAQQAGLHEVPVILKISDEQNALELALIENIQRENLNPIEEAEAYQHLLSTYQLTQQQLADKIGKERVTIANTLRLLGLAPETRAMLAKNELTMGHAKVLLAVADPKQQRQLAEKVRAKKLSVRELEREVGKAIKPMIASQSTSLNVDVSQKFMDGLAEELQKIIGTKVVIDYSQGRGKIGVYFYSDAELNEIVDHLKDAWHK